MATFKCKEDGAIIHEDSRKMKIEVGGIVYYRVYAEKFVSRQHRLYGVIDQVKNLIDFLDETIEGLNNIPYMDDYKEAYDPFKSAVAVLCLDFLEVTKLKEEMNNWKEKLTGTGLERTTRYKEVEAASDDLIEACEMIGALALPEDGITNGEYHKKLSDLRDDLIPLINNLWRVYLPPMYS